MRTIAIKEVAVHLDLPYLGTVIELTALVAAYRLPKPNQSAHMGKTLLDADCIKNLTQLSEKNQVTLIWTPEHDGI